MELLENIADYVRHAKKRLHFIPKRKETATNESYDLFEEERRQWEIERLNQPMEFDEKLIDPAPFQLVRLLQNLACLYRTGLVRPNMM